MFQNKDVDSAVKLMSNNVKSSINSVFTDAVNGKASAENKLKVIEAAIISRRDLINGVPQDYVAWNFCRLLAK